MINDFRKIGPMIILTGQENKHAFSARMIPSYAMLRHVNTQLPENSYVFTIYMNNLAHLFNRPFCSDSMFESYTIETILNNSKRLRISALPLKKGFTHILYDINYAIGDAGTFSEENKNLFMALQQNYLRLAKTDKRRYFLYRFGEPSNTPAS